MVRRSSAVCGSGYSRLLVSFLQGLEQVSPSMAQADAMAGGIMVVPSCHVPDVLQGWRAALALFELASPTAAHKSMSSAIPSLDVILHPSFCTHFVTHVI